MSEAICGTCPRMSLRSSGLRVPRKHDRTHVLILATRFARAIQSNCPSPKTEGAGKAGRWPHPRAWCAAVVRIERTPVSTGSAGTTGLPCAMVLRLIRALLGAPGLLAAVARKSLASLVPASGDQDHTISPSAPTRIASAHRKRPSHPDPNVRGDRAKRPSCGSGRAQDNHKSDF